METNHIIPSSFRDPSGFLFQKNGFLYRQINTCYRENYGHLMNSGLYNELVNSQLLIPHQEVKIDFAKSDKAYKVLKPEKIPFISYPYEWCFSQLKDSALVTLKIQKKSLEFGMSLKDCSAFNIQFRNGKPIFIDTLSFEKYEEGKPWVAYRQFCQHFLAPLTLMTYKDIRLNQLLRIYIDGIPLDLTSSLLPFYTRLRFSLLTHIHLHAKSQNYFRDKQPNLKRFRLSKTSPLALINNLKKSIRKLKPRRENLYGWANYYEKSNYSDEAFEHKKAIVSQFLEKIRPKTVWDLGANTGIFSRLASSKNIFSVSLDFDPHAVEINYLESVKNKEINILPLVLDLTNPSPAIGWDNTERVSFKNRGPVDAIIALALIHHLAISNNVPLLELARFFSELSKYLIIEFVPKTDSQVQKMLDTRQDIFGEYSQDQFEKIFKVRFNILDSIKIRDSRRSLYLMERIFSNIK